MPLSRLQRSLFILSAITWLVLAVMCLHQSEPSLLLGRFSPRYALLLIIMLVAGVSLSLLTAAASQGLGRVPRAANALQSLAGIAVFCLLMAILWLVVPISDIEAGPLLFRLYAAGVLMALAVGWTSDPQIHLPVRWVMVGAGAALLIALMGVLLLIARTPPVRHFDEGWVSAFAWSWVRTGSATDIPVLLNSYKNGYNYLNLVSLSSYLLGIVLNITTTFTAARVWAIGLMLVSLPVLYACMRPLLARPTRLMVCAAAAPLYLIGAYIRNDALVPLLLTVALLLYSRASQRFVSHMLIGIVLAAGIEGHQLAVRFAIAFGILYAVAYVHHIYTTRRMGYAPFWGLLSGGLIYGLIYVVSRLLIWNFDLSQFIAQIQMGYQIEMSLGGGLSQSERFIAGVTSFVAAILRFYPMVALVMAVTSAVALYQRDALLRFSVALWWVAAVLHVLLNPKPWELYELFYSVHMLPVVLLCLVLLLKLVHDRIGATASLALISCVVSLNLSQAVLTGRGQSHNDLIDAGYTINERLPDTVKVVSAGDTLWWGLHERTFYMTISFPRSAGPIADVLERFNGQPIDAFALVANVDTQPLIPDYIRQEGMVRSFCLPTEGFGAITVYVRADLAIERDTDCN